MFVHNGQRGSESDVFVFTGIPVHAFSVLLSANDSVVNSPLAPSTINLTASRSRPHDRLPELVFSGTAPVLTGKFKNGLK